MLKGLPGRLVVPNTTDQLGARFERIPPKPLEHLSWPGMLGAHTQAWGPQGYEEGGDVFDPAGAEADADRVVASARRRIRKIAPAPSISKTRITAPMMSGRFGPSSATATVSPVPASGNVSCAVAS